MSIPNLLGLARDSNPNQSWSAVPHFYHVELFCRRGLPSISGSFHKG